jgi:hypothetical protein
LVVNSIVVDNLFIIEICLGIILNKCHRSDHAMFQSFRQSKLVLNSYRMADTFVYAQNSTQLYAIAIDMP